MPFKLGMNGWSHDAIKLRFSSYLNRDQLPKVPAIYGHVRSNDVPWQMLGNDAYGDCVIAGACHEIMTWALATQTHLPNFNAQTVVNQYLNLTGGKDTGLDPIAAAKWRVATGVQDADGIFHKVKAFASINNDSDLDLAAYIFGACGIGFNLPKTALAEFENEEPWSDISDGPVGGHYVPLVGRNSKGLRFVITWGRLQAVTDRFWQRYFLGGVAYFSEEYLLANGVSPEGIKGDELNIDLAAL